MKAGEIIGTGKTAAVYEWGKDKALKLFIQGYPETAVLKEFNNACLLKGMDFCMPNAYEIVKYDGRTGIIYDRVRGESLLEWVMKTNDVHGCASRMAKLHGAILGNSISGVSDYKDFLRSNIMKSAASRSADKKELMNIIDRLPDGSALCHGDFHPGNIFISDDTAVVIDFMNVCHGPYLFDIARTVFLLEYASLPPDADHIKLQQLRCALAELYLAYMNTARGKLEEYLMVIGAARIGECPDE